jgi:hypothetical protein
MTPEELRKARQSVGKASADASGDSSDAEDAAPSESEASDDHQRQMSRRAEALIARQAEEAKKKQEKK